ncbi:NAD(P)H-binding protein [Calidifontibacter terrae]
MTTFAVTAATGHLGRAALESLLEHHVVAGDVIALVRDITKAAPLAAQGVAVRHFDFDEPAGHAAALSGVDRLLFVSGPGVGDREGQHRNVIAAAERAGVHRLVYTSFIGARSHPENPLTPEHEYTEKLLERADVPQVVVLRNGYYHENALAQLDQVLDSGVLVGSSGSAPISAAARADLAEAAAVALLDDSVQPGVYELVGPDMTKADMAAQISHSPRLRR